jgi:hypothetical protein
MSKCALPSCGKEIESTRKGVKYCSVTCRSKHSIYRTTSKALNGLVEGGLKETETKSSEVIENEQPKRITVDHGMYAKLPESAQFIIKQQEKDAARWEDAYKEERKERKKLKNENKELRQELAEVKTDERLKGIETAANANKKDLFDRIMESPIGEHIGPALGTMLDKFMNGTAPVIGQVGGVADGPADDRIVKIANWYATQPDEVKEVFFMMVDAMAGMEPNMLKMRMNFLRQSFNIKPGGQSYAA